MPRLYPAHDGNRPRHVAWRQAAAWLLATTLCFLPANARFLSPNARFLPPNACFLPPNARFLPPDACFLPPDACFLPPEPRFLPPDARFLPPDARFLPPDARFLPPNARFLPPDACFLPPDACFLPPANMCLLSGRTWRAAGIACCCQRLLAVDTARAAARDAGCLSGRLVAGSLLSVAAKPARWLCLVRWPGRPPAPGPPRCQCLSVAAAGRRTK
jgi:hypothetical protein